MSTIRAFLAVPIPTGLRKRVGQLIGQLKGTGVRLRWVDESTAHITVCFLGDIDLTRVADACKAVDEGIAEFGPSELTLQGLGAFPDLAKARVLWVGIKAGGEPLVELHRRMVDRFQDHRFMVDRGRYHPHLTLARVPGGGVDRSFPESLAAHLDSAVGTMVMNRLVLYSSDLEPAGPIYRPLAHFDLVAR